MQSIKIFNTLNGKKELFQPVEKGKARMYLCGPTVYDLGHLGHARSAVAFDVIQKYLRYSGYEVRFVSNYTDIDDKMIKRADELGITVNQLADKIIPEYQADYGALNIQTPDHQPKATSHIPTMIKIVKNLIKKGHAYQTKDGVYFDVTSFKNYGKLSGQKLEDLEAGARVEINEDKHSPHDFVLWKNEKPGEPAWESPFGRGRPGWHIECSAMNLDLLGETIDIHGGGSDLIFPHHEDEIAQSECFSGRTFAKYWLHNGFIKIDNEKMSKSLGNFFTIKDILKKYPAAAVRYFLICTHYRSPIHFSEELIDQAINGLARVNDFIRNLKKFFDSEKAGNTLGQKNKSSQSAPEKIDIEKKFAKILENSRLKFEKAMNNDFEVPKALGVIFELIKNINTKIAAGQISAKNARDTIDLLKKFDKVLCVINFEDTEIPPEIQQLINEREKARVGKNWRLADEIRTKISQKGYEVEDTKEGTVCKKK